MTLSEEFLANGIVKIQVENLQSLAYFLNRASAFIEDKNLNNFRLRNIENGNLNNFRLKQISLVNGHSATKNNYLSLAKSSLHELVGNELVMQRNINLSIQLPGDTSSLLPIHADVLQGDSPYEVVLWVPLVDCYDSKSMFFSRKQPSIEGKTLEQLYEECDPYFVDCKYGEALIFSQNYFHGNRVNETNETRWSLNCRFKSLFSPYADKKLGEFFEPIEIRPATRLGLAYGG